MILIKPTLLLNDPLLLSSARVLGTSFGDHVGDWEHVMIRFQDSLPTAIYLSQHDSGTAYSWDAIIKNPDGRPVVYIGEGDHACYAMVSFLHHHHHLSYLRRSHCYSP